MRVALGMILFISSASAAEIGFRWDPLTLAWSLPGLPQLSDLAPLFSIFELLFLMPGKTRLRLIFVVVKVFGVAPCWIFGALCNFLTLLMFEIEIRACFEVFWLGVYGMVSC